VKKSILSSKVDLLALSKDILKRGKSIRFQARGWSMRPFIRDGDFITVSPVEDSALKTGDVVLYLGGGNQVIVHRIINKYKKERRVTLLIKGDAGFGSAEKVDVQNILGKVTAIERNGRLKRLDTKPQQIIGVFVAGMSPFSRWIYPTGSLVKQSGRSILGVILEKIQGLNIYGFLVKKFIKGDILYKCVSPDEAYSLSEEELKLEFEKTSHARKKKQSKAKDSDYCFVAQRKGRIIGSVTLTKSPLRDYPYSGWWIFGLGVNRRYRGLGIGENLVKMAVETAVKHKGSEIKLLAFEDAKRALKLYEKLGYRQISIPELDKELIQEAKKTLRRRIILAKNIKSG
jgi:signal peptidase I